MRSLLTISFDNTRRLKKRTHYFRYRDVTFKLIQDDPRKHSDHLLAITENDDARHRAFRAAAEFMSALAWENHSRIAIWEAGHRNWPAPFTLRHTGPSILVLPRIPFQGGTGGYGIDRIPLVETDAQRLALALFREARASNNDYLRFLFFWQVLEVQSTSSAVGFVDSAFRRDRARLRIPASVLAALPLAGRTLGNYLLDDCRHAIAHIHRKPGRRPLDIDDPTDRQRLFHSAYVIEAFAEHFIKHKLQLTKVAFLRRPKRGAVATYVPA